MNEIDACGGVRRIAVVADSTVSELHLATLIGALRVKPAVVSFPAGESSKTLEQAELIFDAFSDSRLGRDDLVITFGGGVAGDLGGFAAATWMRGLRYIQVPTTLVAAVDASVGGKTGVNHASGKNLIGAFHQPSAVIVDTDFLETLAQRDWIAGLAESVKHAATRDADFLDWHEQHQREIAARNPQVTQRLIARNCEIKAEVVSQDEREQEFRMVLNHGHTIGHAIEHLMEYELRHGECVALGMVVENEISRARGLLDDDAAKRVRRLLERFGLPVRLPRAVATGEILDSIRLDKKARGDVINFALIRALGRWERARDVRDDEIERALLVVSPGQ